MKNRLIMLRNRISESYWFIPGVMVLLSILLSILSIKLDELVGRRLAWVIGLVYVDSPEGAREVLSAIAGSMITVAGVVFSLTMVVLTLTSQQYGPLVLGNFMRDRGNQFVLGVFTATFTYCLLILRTIRGVENSAFVPHISVLVGITLALISIIVIIYFIHHVSESIRSSNIIGLLANDLVDQIDDLFPAQLGHDPVALHIKQPEQHMPKNFDTQSAPIQSRDSGYLQMVDVERLLDVAQRYDLVIDLKHCPGDFVPQRSILALVWPVERITPEIVDKINDAMIQGNSRTEEQDVEYIFNKLAMIAVRALSPAINDPFTAIMCIDRLALTGWDRDCVAWVCAKSPRRTVLTIRIICV
jgi:uncharacterized membrane protein